MNASYLTVAIPYVNASPHLGYAYELVLADIHARACRLDGIATRFLGGTDDYSLKNVLAAESAGEPTQQFVDRHADRFEALAGPLDLSFDDFIRTSVDQRHEPAVHRLWRAVDAAGDLYRRSYEGEYCVGCERFYSPDELHDGRCPEHDRPVEHVAEENWFFRLSRHQAHLDHLISSGAVRVSPPAFEREVLAFIRSGLDDISVSRSVERARGWGVPVPGDPAQVVYVWFDALTNYLSALGFGDLGSDDFDAWWTRADERTHVVGKGILRFHAVYWLAFLASAGLPQPTHIRVHPYLTIEQQKLSKSSGPVVDPSHLAHLYGTDALRWWFARDVAESVDTDFTVERLIARANEDLAAGIGNVTNRIATLIHRFRHGQAPAAGTPLDQLAHLPSLVRQDLRRFELRAAAQKVVGGVAVLNQHLERTAPWQVAKARGRGDQLDEVLGCQLASALVIAEAVEPITPQLADRLRHQLSGPTLPPAVPVVPRLEEVAPPSPDL